MLTLSDFDFELPSELIASRPLDTRVESDWEERAENYIDQRLEFKK